MHLYRLGRMSTPFCGVVLLRCGDLHACEKRGSVCV
jgi:hypothetical protein